MRGKRLIAWSLAIVTVIANSQDIKATENIATQSVSPENNIEATGSTDTDSYISGNYTYTINSDEKTCTITKYTGTEENVTIPETIDGYIVTILDEYPFAGNNNVINITLPKTVFSTGVYTSDIAPGAINLENIYVDDKNPVYYDVDGILYKRGKSGIIMCEFPAGKNITSFRIPNNTSYIDGGSFFKMQYLEKLIIPNTVKALWIGAIGKSKLDIILSSTIQIDSQAFSDMYSGTKIIVPNSTVAASVAAGIKPVGDSNVQVINLAEAEKAQYTVSSTSLTFADGTVSKDVTMSTGGTYSLIDQYTLSPADTTENVIWSSSNSNIATVDSITGLVKAVALGSCTITGADESGHIITVSINVYQGIDSVEMYCDSSNPSTYSVVYDSANNTKWIRFRTTPARASNWDKTVWESSDPSVATVQKDDTDKEYALLTFLAPGTTTITATIDDNGTIWTKSFVLTVTKSLANCTVSSIANQSYSGSEITPAVTVMDGTKELKEGTDYTLSYSNNINAGTALVTISAAAGSSYTGSTSKSFVINKANYDFSHVSWTATKFLYNGANQTVALTGLPDGVSVTYVNNVKLNPGSYTAKASLSYDTVNHNKPVTTYSTTWTISPVAQIISFSSGYVSDNNMIVVPYSTKNFKLGGSAQTAISYSSGNKKVAAVDKNGKVSINGTGYTTIIVSAKQTSAYKKASITLKVYVSPQKQSITSLKSSTKGMFTVQWNKDTKATGYQIQYATNKYFSDAKTVTVSKNSAYSQTIKKLVKGKKYYVRVRAYKSASKKCYGEWSSTRTVKIKK